MWSSVLGIRLCWPWGRGSFYGLILHKAHNNLSVHSPARPLNTMQATVQPHIPASTDTPTPSTTLIPIWRFEVRFHWRVNLFCLIFIHKMWWIPQPPHCLSTMTRATVEQVFHWSCMLDVSRMPTFADCKEHPHDRGWFWSTLFESLRYEIFKLGVVKKKRTFAFSKKTFDQPFPSSVYVRMSCLLFTKSNCNYLRMLNIFSLSGLKNGS